MVTIFSLLLSGCFETKFDSKTVVNDDGSVSRETRMDGRGTNLFKVPEGPGWESRRWETKGDETIFVSLYHHVLAYGQFEPNQMIASDYQFDMEKQSQDWSDEQLKRLEAAGIHPPYEKNLFSKNEIQVRFVKGWLTQTYFYEEVFRNVGIIGLLLVDIEGELKRDTNLGVGRSEEEIDTLSRERLEKDFLGQIRFRSEVTMPGKLLSSNAHKKDGNKSIWEFSLKDFDEDYSVYTLQVVSRGLRLPGLIFVLGIGLLGLVIFVLIMLGTARLRNKAHSLRKRNRQPSSERER